MEGGRLSRSRRHDAAVAEAGRVLERIQGPLAGASAFDQRDVIIYSLLAFADREQAGEWRSGRNSRTEGDYPMSFSYYQSSGEFFHNGKLLATGYSGAGEGKNNPAMQEVPNTGPLPKGKYSIGEPFDSETHGPHAMHLSPAPENEMFGRGGFLIHGDSIAHPGAASEGCIILPRDVREYISRSGDRDLTVTDWVPPVEMESA